MKAIEAFFDEKTQSQNFRVTDKQPRRLGERDVRVQVKAVAVNPVDFKVASRQSDASAKPKVLGWDAAGTILEIGEGVKHYRVGDDVYYAGAINQDGANSETHVVDERIVGRKPRKLSFKEAAAIPLTAITAWEAIFTKLKLHREKPATILILGAAGGVGSLAIQLLKNLTAATVVATASRPESERWVRELGADEVVDHRGDIGAQLKRIGHPEVDAILCFNDTDTYFPQFAAWTKPFGHIVSIVETTKPVDLEAIKGKSLTFSWELMFTRSLHQTPDMDEQRQLLDDVSQLLDSGKLKTTLGLDLGDLTIDNLRTSHELLKSGKAIGKIVMGPLNERK